MKLAICAGGEGSEAMVDHRFGRCPYFVIVDSESGQVLESVRNRNADAAGGAGPQSAQLLSEHGVGAVILGSVGPNAATALDAAGIKAYSGVEGTVEETFRKYMSGDLKAMAGATVPSHHGMRGRR